MTKFEEAMKEWHATMDCLRLHAGPRLVTQQDGDHFSIYWVACPQCGRKPSW